MAMMRSWRRMIMACAVLAGTPVCARDSLGVYNGWGAFRDKQPHRCYAIATPDKHAGGNGRWKPFASVATWPDVNAGAGGVRGQVHIRLSNTNSGPLELKIDDAHFTMVSAGADAWAPNAATDAAIVTAIRSGRAMSVGRNDYTLRGAASAIDAAALGCARVK